jgi:preprotein translocase subunit SecE
MDLVIFILKIAAGIGAVAAAVMAFRHRLLIITFIQEVLAELKKVSWTSRKDLVNATWIVLISAICLGIFITCIDLCLSRAMHAIIR